MTAGLQGRQIFSVTGLFLWVILQKVQQGKSCICNFCREQDTTTSAHGLLITVFLEVLGGSMCQGSDFLCTVLTTYPGLVFATFKRFIWNAFRFIRYIIECFAPTSLEFFSEPIILQCYFERTCSKKTFLIVIYSRFLIRRCDFQLSSCKDTSLRSVYQHIGVGDVVQWTRCLPCSWLIWVWFDSHIYHQE